MNKSKSMPRVLPDKSLFGEAAKNITLLRPELLKWFRKQARTLPWRASPSGKDPLYTGETRLRRNPYAAWIAEIMLQQTQVSTVVPYFEKWMGRFPDAGALARAPEAEVMKYWAGLGYYARARNLHRAAQMILEKGRYPTSSEGWLALPGIGAYTAGAVSSLAFNLSEPILDGNVTRVLSRVHGLAFLPGNGLRQKEAYWSLARNWADVKTPGDTNEALMELGALVCTPSAPQCGRCPLALHCKANLHGWQDSLPPVKPRARVEAVSGIVVIAVHRGKVLLVERGKGGFLAGHDMFPLWLKVEMDEWKTEFHKLVSGHEAVVVPQKLGVVNHAIMNHRYKLQVLRVKVKPRAGSASKVGRTGKWISENEVENLLTNSLARKIWSRSVLAR